MWYVPRSGRVFSSLLKQQHSEGSGSSSEARPGRRPSRSSSPSPIPHFLPSRRHQSLSALYLQHQREQPGAQTQCVPPQSEVRGRGAGAAAPQKPSVSNAKFPLYLANSGLSKRLPPCDTRFHFSSVQGGRLKPVHPAALRPRVPLRGNMVQCTHSPRRLY